MHQGLLYFSATGVALLAAMFWHTRAAPDAAADPWRRQVTEVVNHLAEQLEQPRREQVIQLPEDAGAWYLTLFYRDRQRDPASVRLAEMFNQTPRLTRLIQQTHFNKYQPGHPLYDHRYRLLIGGAGGEHLPAVILQQSDGRVVYKASAGSIPTDGELLADDLAAAIAAIADCGPRPRPAPGPSPQPSPATPARIPDLLPRDRVATRDEGLPTWLLLLVPVLSGGLGAYHEMKRTHQGV